MSFEKSKNLFGNTKLFNYTKQFIFASTIEIDKMYLESNFVHNFTSFALFIEAIKFSKNQSLVILVKHMEKMLTRLS